MLHGANQYFGLVPAREALQLGLMYAVLSVAAGIVIRTLLKDERKAAVFTCLLLAVFFLFGAIKNLLASYALTSTMSSYTYLLPLLLVLVLLVFFNIRRSTASFQTAFRYTRLLLLLLVAVEITHLLANIFVLKHQRDFGDEQHQLIKNLSIDTSKRRPDIFWIIFDEYAASSTLLKKWNFKNPLDTQLRRRGFFVADSALSPYNYSHYAIGSMLDMTYFESLHDGDIVTYKDIVLGIKSVYENNFVELLSAGGYAINNYSLFDMEGYPTHSLSKFAYHPSLMISNSTLSTRIQEDIGWNFSNLFANDKHMADAKDLRSTFQQLAAKQHFLIDHYKEVVKRGSKSTQPGLYLLHYMVTHEPFLFNSDGTLHPAASFTKPDAYLSSVQYANQVITEMVDLIRSSYTYRDFIIVLQSDHGFKFEETDPHFEEESCKILYAVFSSDGNHHVWPNDINAVNGFRILLNKYFATRLPMLPSRTHVLQYREQDQDD